MLRLFHEKQSNNLKGEQIMSHDETHNCTDGACDCGSGCGCECGGDGHTFQRRFQTKAEQIEELEVYLVELKLEMQAVDERLADLRK
jgi:hypothetical protein